MRLLIIILAIGFGSLVMQAQDPHLSQHDVSPVMYNPALTGIFYGADLRAVSQFRSQWGVIGNSFATSTLAFDMPYDKKWGVGGYLLNDDGAKTYSTFGMALSSAYLITSPYQRKMQLSVGLQAGFFYKSTNKSDLVFDSQYADGVFDPDKASGESFERYQKLMPEVALGINYTCIDVQKKFKPFGNFAVYHATHPKENFVAGSEPARLPLRFNFEAGGDVELNSMTMIRAFLFVMKQSNLYEIVPGAWTKFNLNMYFSLLGGLSYRHKDAIILMAGTNYKNLTFRVSYDINISELRHYTSYKGGLELSVVFVQKNRRKSNIF